MNNSELFEEVVWRDLAAGGVQWLSKGLQDLLL